MQITIHRNRRPVGILILILYFATIAAVITHAWRNPEYNWDMLAYMAVVIGQDHHNITEIHQETYAAARDHLPSAAFRMLTNPAHVYRARMYQSDTAFYQQLPFYVVKPLYTALVYLGHRAGVSLPAATVLPSVAAYLGIAILLLIWACRYLPLHYAAGSALLLMTSAPLLAIPGLSTPDALSSFLLLAVFYFTVEKPNLLLMLILLGAALCARLDNIIAGLVLVFFLAISKQSPFRIGRIGYAAIVLGLSALYLIIAHRATGMGFGVLFYPSFMRYMNMPHQFHADYSLAEYLQVFHAVAITGLFHSAVTIFGFLALLLFFKNARRPWRSLSFYAWLPILCCFVVAVRFVMDPDISDRFYIPYYLLIALLWIRAFSQNSLLDRQTAKTPRI